MRKDKKSKNNNPVIGTPSKSLFGLLKDYSGIIALLIFLTIAANALSISVPKIIAGAIDDYSIGSFSIEKLVVEFSVIAVLIFVFTYLQNVAQVIASERVARDMRSNIAAKISVQPYSYIETATPAKLLTNLTSDVDAIKTFVSMAVPSIISSVFLIIGVSVLLILTDWKLALAVLSVMPVIGLTFFFVFRKVRKLFLRVQESIDWLNKVISESILGAALVRLLDSQKHESSKFLAANTQARDISFEILKLFSSLIPVINFFTNVATLVIIILGGHFVIQGDMTLGSFTAFNSYLAILIFPIIILGFVSNLVAQAQASYERILLVLDAPLKKKSGKLKAAISGNIEVRDLSISFAGKSALRNVSLSVPRGSRTAIIGPTAAGKTQLLYSIIGLTEPSSGEILFDGKRLDEYDKESLHSRIGFVFQDSVIFNLSLKENIAFSSSIRKENIEKAIETAELKDYVESLPKKLKTMASERGTSLSGGQKQRIMLARALALDPKILLLDDFTARVDSSTEKKILENIARNYPDITLVSVTQKISSIEHYDQIILLMEGELLTKGTHDELMQSSPEYVQIFQSQRSTSEYESSQEK
ncbi:MAG: ABC transporter ATP-binding protein [Candidatus Moranbacteria bacterium]|nr:ABC transporter ATP-binding protein [Candidatus Moranbacteria bacterium]